MRLVEFLVQIDEAKFRKPVVMYHGTSSAHLRSILKQGIVPDPKEKVWATDPDISPHSFSRASLRGSYWSSDLGTASSSATTATYHEHFGGSPLIVVAQISEGSAFADEDDLNFKINWALGDMYNDLFGGGIVSEFVPKVSAIYYWGEGKQKEMIESFGRTLHENAAIDPEKQPINWEFMKELLEAVMMRQLAYTVYEQARSKSYYRDSYVKEMERLHGEGQAPVIPPIEEVENHLLKLREIGTRLYRKTLYPEKHQTILRNTLRTEQPVTYRGANKILAIIGDPARGGSEKGSEWWRKPKILYYGTPPDDYFKQYRKSMGPFPGAVNTKGQMVIPPEEKKQVAASVGGNEGETYSAEDPDLEMNPKKIVPKGALADAGTSSGWDWMDAVHGYERGSMSMVEQVLGQERKYLPMTETPFQAVTIHRPYTKGSDYVETYINPSNRELAIMTRVSTDKNVRAFVIGNDLLAWPITGGLHAEIRRELNIPETAIPIILFPDPHQAYIIVTDTTVGTAWHHNPQTANAIRSNGYLSRRFESMEVGYYDEVIVGDWEELRESEEDDADEAIGTYKTIGDFDKPTIGFKKAADRRIVSNPTIIQRTRDKFARTDHPFNFYFVNLPGVGKHQETGMVGRDWLDQYMPKVSKQIPTDNMHVNVIFVGNTAAEWKPMTPWIMAHRIGHVFQRQGPAGKLHSWKEAENALIRVTNYIFENAYGKSKLHPRYAGYGMEWERIRLDQRTFKFWWQNVATFRSAREGKIRDWFEVLHELFAQYLITGKIKFNPLPKHISKPPAFRHAGIYIGFKGDEQDYEYFNEMLQDLAEELEDYFDNAIGEATGHFFVM